MSVFVAWLLKKDRLPENPLARVDAPAGGAKTKGRRALAVAQVQQLLDATGHLDTPGGGVRRPRPVRAGGQVATEGDRPAPPDERDAYQRRLKLYQNGQAFVEPGT